MSAKDQYRAFCLSETVLPIFYQPWYLDIVAGHETWDVVLEKKSDRTVAVMPYCMEKRMGIRLIGMPMLCRFLGPYIVEDLNFGKHIRQLHEALIQQLPRFDVFAQAFHYRTGDYLKFYWKGFRAHNRYSYCIENIQELEAVYQNFSADYRKNKIQPASEALEFSDDVDLDVLIRLQDETFERQCMTSPVSNDLIRRLDTAVSGRKCGRLIGVKDDDGRWSAVAYLIWDAETVYYLMSANDVEGRSSGAGILLIWHAIRYAADVLGKQHFDFLGSMIPEIAQVRRQLGAKPNRYFMVTKYPTWRGKLFYGQRVLRDRF